MIPLGPRTAGPFYIVCPCLNILAVTLERTYSRDDWSREWPGCTHQRCPACSGELTLGVWHPCGADRPTGLVVISVVADHQKSRLHNSSISRRIDPA